MIISRHSYNANKNYKKKLEGLSVKEASDNE